MIIKKYMANNMNEALVRIRSELGRDAVIISQRKVKRPGVMGIFSPKQIEVTAAVENHSKSNNSSASTSKHSQYKDDSIKDIQRMMNLEILRKGRQNIQESQVEQKKEATFEQEFKSMKLMINEVLKNTSKARPKEDELLKLLKNLDIDLEFYKEIVDKVSGEDINDGLRKVIKDSIEISSEDLKGNVVLVGPTGVGKTTTIAKLAGKLALVEKKKVGLITIDTYRIGAVEQLKTYAEIMNIPFRVVITTKEMEEAISEMKDCDVVLIDTTGRSSKNKMQLSELRAYVDKAKPDTICAVISATTKNKDIKSIIDGYNDLNFDNIIVTKLDETTTYGSIYNIQRRANKPLKFVTTGQNVPDDIKEPTKDDVVKFIFGEEVLC